MTSIWLPLKFAICMQLIFLVLGFSSISEANDATSAAPPGVSMAEISGGSSGRITKADLMDVYNGGVTEYLSGKRYRIVWPNIHEKLGTQAWTNKGSIASGRLTMGYGCAPRATLTPAGIEISTYSSSYSMCTLNQTTLFLWDQ